LPSSASGFKRPSSRVATRFVYLTFDTTTFSANYFEIPVAMVKGDVSKLIPYFTAPSGIVIFIAS